MLENIIVAIKFMSPHQFKYLFPLLMLTVLKVSVILACDCKSDSTISDSIKRSDIVFKGKVISKILTNNFDSLGVKTKGDTTKIYFFNPYAIIKVKIEKVYKSRSLSDTITILTPHNDEYCGYHFQIDQKYIIYARTTDDLVIGKKLMRETVDQKTFWTNKCMRTQDWNKKEEKEISDELK